MSTNELTAISNPARRTNLVLKLIPVVAIVAVVAAGIITYILPPRWHPTLEVKNTGMNAVAILFKGESFMAQPGQTWHMRFYGGDTLTFRAGEADDAASITVELPQRNPKPWTLNPIAQRWTAEINADDAKNIRFENRRFEEITAPPSASKPWP